jgi:hypothetical protein
VEQYKSEDVALAKTGLFEDPKYIGEKMHYFSFELLLYKRLCLKKQNEINKVKEKLEGTDYEVYNLDLVKGLMEVVESLVFLIP